MKKNILFIEPRGAKTNFFTNSNFYPLLGPLYLGTQLYESGHSVKIIKEMFVKEKTLYNSMRNADILILTMITNCAYRAYEIAKIYKKLRPDGKIIAGGIHASIVPEEVLQYVDQVAIGEGSLIINDIINNKIKDKIIKCPPLKNLDQRPIPNFSLFCNSNKIKNIPLMTSLGCPYNCTFCCVTNMYGKKYRFQSPDKTIKELKHHFKQLGKKNIFFYDDNFCANKNNSLELFDKIKENNLKFQWGCQLRADLAKDEIFVKRMASAGCNRVYIGFESINENTLNDFNKNESVDEIEMAIKIFHKYGITIHGMFIMGTDHDNIDVFGKTVNFCINKNIESAQFFSITPFPGTEFWNKLDKSRLIHQNWDILDGFHVNMIPKNMTEYQLMEGILYVHEKFYSWNKIIKQLYIDILFILRNNNRNYKYKIQKMFRNYFKSIGFRFMIKKWKKEHQEYHLSLKEKHYQELELNKEELETTEFDNKHAGVGMD